MSHPLAGLRPERLWKHFHDLTQIPRPSGHEAATIAHIRAWAESHGFTAIGDEAGNLLVRVPATPGREGAIPTLIQGHVDMVPEQDPGRGFDFTRDPIEAYVSDGWVRARGTTLGADNGIGVAAGMAVADDPSVSHGPLELLFTVEEETGLNGAGALAIEGIQAKQLLNLDSEELGVLYVGCAGGGQDRIELDFDRTAPHGAPGGDAALTVSVAGLLGGHSGLEIGAHHASAVKLLTRVLWGLREEVPFALDGFDGGTAHNAIPKAAKATIVVGSADAARTREIVLALAEETRREYADHEPEMAWDVADAALAETVLATRDRDRFLRLILALPHGVQEMSREMPGLVETSANVARVLLEGPSAKIVVSSRSSIAEALGALRMRVAAVGELASGRVIAQAGYPAWRPNIKSPLLQRCREVWQARTGQDPQVTAIHAGLECGVLGEKIPGLDMISFGPTLLAVHTTGERIEIAAVETFWEFLADLLRAA
jgi:dipeptidase D